jgi:hypothetical protein
MMQKVGDACDNCREFWEKKNKEPKTLKRLGGVTQNHKVIVPACEYCDGDALKISALGNHDPLEPA